MSSYFMFTHKSKFTNSRIKKFQFHVHAGNLFHAFTRKKIPFHVFTTEKRAVHAFTQTTGGGGPISKDYCVQVSQRKEDQLINQTSLYLLA